jgi:hypothetical protein
MQRQLRCAFLVLAIIAGVSLGWPTSAVLAIDQTIDVANNSIANLVGDGVTNNRNAFQTLIDSTAGYNYTTIDVPSGVYAFSGARIFMRSNITINFEDGAVFRTAPVLYISRTASSIEGPRNVIWNNCYFEGGMHHTLVHAADITFNDCTWDNVQLSNGHAIDIAGSHDIVINRNKFIGHADNFTSDQTILYKEAVQVDYAYQGGTGVSDALLAQAGATSAVHDNAPSYNITVQDSQFLPSYNADGSINRHSTVPMGEHVNICSADINDCLRNIKFINNYVLDSMDIGTPESDNGLLHWRTMSGLEIRGNIFQSTTPTTNNNLIYLRASVGTPGIHDVKISDNQFVAVQPRQGYVYMRAADSGTPIGVIDQVEICNNQFFLSSPTKHAPLLAKSGSAISNIYTDCNNQFRPLAEFDTCLIGEADCTTIGEGSTTLSDDGENGQIPSAPETGVVTVGWSTLAVTCCLALLAMLIGRRSHRHLTKKP